MTLTFFLFVDLGGTVTGRLHPASLIAAAAWAGPLWIYGCAVRTRPAAVGGGAVLVGATAAFLVAVFRDTHSTAGIGVVTVPMLLYPLAVGVLAIDRLLFARRSGGPVLRGFVRRLLAVGLSFVVAVAATFAFVGILGLFDFGTSDDRGASAITTVLSAVTAAGGALGISRLWREARPRPPRDHAGS